MYIFSSANARIKYFRNNSFIYLFIFFWHAFEHFTHVTHFGKLLRQVWFTYTSSIIWRFYKINSTFLSRSEIIYFNNFNTYSLSLSTSLFLYYLVFRVYISKSVPLYDHLLNLKYRDISPQSVSKAYCLR